MKAVFEFTIACIICLIITSCCTNGDTYEFIKKEYIPLYKNGDTLVFKSDKGVFDTMYIVDTVHSFYGISNKDFCGTNHNYEFLGYYFDTIIPSKTIYYELDIISVGHQNNINIDFKDLFYKNYFAPSSLSDDFYTIIDEIKIEEVIYKNVFNFFPYNSELSRTILYDKKYGIISYTDSANTWNLINKNKKNEKNSNYNTIDCIDLYVLANNRTKS